jgi:thioredoxin 1
VVSKLNANDLQTRLSNSEGFSLVTFTDTWNPACSRFEPMFDKVAIEKRDIPAFLVDVDTNPDIARSYSVRSVPDVVLLKDGKPVSRSVGFVSEEQMRNWLAGYGL